MKTFHKHPPPPLDIVCVTSSALRKIEKYPHSWTFTSTHTLGHCLCDVIHIPRGGGVIGPGHEHFAIGFQYQDKFKGGGGDHPCTPPDPPLDKKKKNRSRAPVVKLKIYICPLNCVLATSCDPLYLRPILLVGWDSLAYSLSNL